MAERQRYLVGVQDTPPVFIVTDCVEGVSCELWARQNGVETPLLWVLAQSPEEAVKLYLEHLGKDASKLSEVKRAVVNLYEYREFDIDWEE